MPGERLDLQSRTWALVALSVERRTDDLYDELQQLDGEELRLVTSGLALLAAEFAMSVVPEHERDKPIVRLQAAEAFRNAALPPLIELYGLPGDDAE
ncbi:hypothetical protein PV350_13925 [Streptomyces sp. PA03-6a]|nr:hypothetical protein [Streptomyces sp. PA03-6a]